ncbi:uncharacterized protein TNCV_5084811 [Trichonephila clavipes]|uniref:DUF4817 domain-containing protein n=1 Tax=Trichonephila clavipes TaxID=2585209 RepID=A0A8X6VC92_TRICX|nr:uncharacterized protein TNCV_5084811 [Trichonephila clavipes]
MRKGPLTAKNLRLMVTKFEETGSLNVRSGRGRKPVSTETIETVAHQVEEDKASNVQVSTSVSRVAEALDLPCSTVQKIRRNILRYHPYKLLLVQELLPRDFPHCSFLLVWKLIQNGLGISSGQTKHTFIWTAEFGKQKIFIPPYKFRYTHQK